jgi:hypothetical protein
MIGAVDRRSRQALSRPPGGSTTIDGNSSPHAISASSICAGGCAVTAIGGRLA